MVHTVPYENDWIFRDGSFPGEIKVTLYKHPRKNPPNPLYKGEFSDS
jgi:hypothetical protein